MPYALDFNFFIFGIVSLALSVVLVALHFVYTWPVEEPWQTYPYLPMERSSELSSGHAAVRTKPQKAKTASVDPPTREELQRLKEVLGIEKGSLQYKKRGQGIYHVLYNEGKYRWAHLGSWIRLKEKLETENSLE